MVIYPDTSFLFSLYGQDTNSEQARKIGGVLKVPFVFTPLHRHELRNAFRLTLFRKLVTPDQCRAVLAAIEDDVKTGALVETPVAWAEVFHTAEALSAGHTETLGTRATDILHVAAASALGAKDFFTFNARQKALAHKAGIKVRP